jgi:hypothetical protein
LLRLTPALLLLPALPLLALRRQVVRDEQASSWCSSLAASPMRKSLHCDSLPSKKVRAIDTETGTCADWLVTAGLENQLVIGTTHMINGDSLIDSLIERVEGALHPAIAPVRR